MSTPKTLVILAAGMASRYGSPKQIDSFGPSGESIIDYTLYDAIQIGFTKIVFVIREQFKKKFKEKFRSKIPDNIIVEYICQELHTYADNYDIPPTRTKPWGTAHAILATKSVTNEPFVVVNADDFYGKNGITKAYHFLNHSCDKNTYGMVGYNIMTTLSNYGSVNRGICSIDDNNNLIDIVEREGIYVNNETLVYNQHGVERFLPRDVLASMNLWIFHHSIFDLLKALFQDFLNNKGQELKSEFYIPDVLKIFIKKNDRRVQVISNDKDSWFGVTYKEDARLVRNQIMSLIKEGQYTSRLW